MKEKGVGDLINNDLKMILHDPDQINKMANCLNHNRILAERRRAREQDDLLRSIVDDLGLEQPG